MVNLSYFVNKDCSLAIVCVKSLFFPFLRTGGNGHGIQLPVCVFSRFGVGQKVERKTEREIAREKNERGWGEKELRE